MRTLTFLFHSVPALINFYYLKETLLCILLGLFNDKQNAALANSYKALSI